MTNFIARLLLALGVLALAACNSSSFSGGSPPGEPTNVKVVAGDSGVTVTWDVQSGIEYWVFSAAASSINTTNWSTLPQAKAVRNATSPQVITGLANGTTYSFTVNGRQGGGAGGPGSPSLSAVPRLTGLAWVLGTPLANVTLRGLNFLALTFPGLFTTVGDAGTIYVSPDAMTWTGLTSGSSTNLNSITYGFGKYVTVGAGGVVLTSVDTVTWPPSTSVTSNDLYAVTTGNGGLIAVGANGTIVRSGDGIVWGASTSGTTNNLYNVGYFNGRYIAVGALGTILVSSDGGVWTPVTSPTTIDLKSVTYRAGVSPLYVAVGVAGTIITSPDSVTWTVVPPVTSATLNSIAVGGQFVAVGDGGVIFVSIDGVNWDLIPSGTTSNLYAVNFGLVGFSAVGANGVNISSF